MRFVYCFSRFLIVLCMRLPFCKKNLAEAKTAVFWDIEDCKIPKGHADDVSHNIKTALGNVGLHGTVSIKAYGDRTTSGYFSTKIPLVHYPAGESLQLSNTLYIFYL